MSENTTDQPEVITGTELAQRQADEKETQKTLAEQVQHLAPVGMSAEIAADYINVVVRDLMNGAAKLGHKPTMGEITYFLQTAQAAGLDPRQRQIYGIYRKEYGQQSPRLTIQTGIDGFRISAERSGAYGGSDEAVFEYRDGWQEAKPEDKWQFVEKATITVYRVNPINGNLMPTTASARWSEYYPGEKMGFQWRKMPEVMLSKVAEARALRKAFPNCHQLYLQEEMQQAERIVRVPKSKNERLAIAEEARKLAESRKNEADNEDAA